jgi:hypothetical protein
MFEVFCHCATMAKCVVTLRIIRDFKLDGMGGNAHCYTNFQFDEKGENIIKLVNQFFVLFLKYVMETI